MHFRSIESLENSKLCVLLINFLTYLYNVLFISLKFMHSLFIIEDFSLTLAGGGASASAGTPFGHIVWAIFFFSYLERLIFF